MRASTLFAVTIAILLGLAAAITVKVTGYFNQPTAVAAAKLPEINVLVAARTIFKGDLIDAPQVRIRQIRADELKDYEQNKDKYLPPVPGATSLRIAAKTLDVDRPIMKDDLEPAVKPDTISMRLLPNMRAINISVPKEQSAGGMIQVGEWVDVLFTTQITVNGINSTRTAAIAHKQRVVAKRNSPWQIFAALPEDKPVHYTIEMNPYRAALVEYCKTRGVLSLLPVSASEQKSLEDRRAAALNNDNKLEQVAFKPHMLETSAEYADEDERIDAINHGEINIGSADLVRIFNIQTGPPPMEKEKPIQIERISGVNRVDPLQFNKDGSVYENPNRYVYGLVRDPVTGKPVAAPKPLMTNRPGQSSSNIDFGMPDLQFGMPKEKGCKNCKEKKAGSTGVAPQEEE